MSLVRPCLPVMCSCHRSLSLTRLHNTDISDTVDDHSVNCCNKDVSLSYRLCLFVQVKHSLAVSSTILIVTDHHPSLHDVPRENVYTLSELLVRSGTLPPTQMEVSVRMEGNPYPMT